MTIDVRDVLFAIGVLIGAAYMVWTRQIMEWSVRWANFWNFLPQGDFRRSENRKHFWFVRLVGAAIFLVGIVGLAARRV